MLAVGRYRINWNFDDWRGYVAERARLLAGAVAGSRRAVVLGRDRRPPDTSFIQRPPIPLEPSLLELDLLVPGAKAPLT